MFRHVLWVEQPARRRAGLLLISTACILYSTGPKVGAAHACVLQTYGALGKIRAFTLEALKERNATATAEAV